MGDVPLAEASLESLPERLFTLKPQLLCKSCHLVMAMYPCSTKTSEVLGNPSPTPERFPETRDSRVEGNLKGVGDGFPNSSRVLVEYGHSPHHQSYP